MDKGRVEAFSDGVMAVAITLLVLDLHADVSSKESLWAQLRHEWPSFASYALSFFVVGVIWVNHHALFSLAAKVDRLVMFYNLLLLLWVSTIPFTTSTLASYLRHGGADARVAEVIYGICMEGMAVSFTLILARLVKADLLVVAVPAAVGRRAVRRFGVGSLLYPLITVIGLVSPVATLVLYGLLTTFYMFEQTPIMGRETADSAG